MSGMKRRCIVKSTARVDGRLLHFTGALWATDDSDARRQELLRLVEMPGSKSQTILSVELDPHASARAT
jgi:hypothetical protein